MAASYADHAADSPYNAHYDRPAMLELCGDIAGKRVLDAGCGPGLYAEALAARGAEVVAFDASEPMVALTRSRLGDRGTVHQLVLGEPLPFAAGEFDLVVSALMIHYVDDRIAALTELHRVLAPHGALVMSTQHPTADWLRKGGSYFDVVVETDIWKRGGDEWAVSFWREPLTTLCDAIYRAGFVIERLVEPLPAASMRDRWPDDYEELHHRPGFVNFRLLKKPEPVGHS